MDRDDDILSYVQGTMSEDQRIQFESDLQTDTQLAAEVDVLLASRDVFAQEAVPAGTALSGWDRLSTSLNEPAIKGQAANDNRAPSLQILRMAAAAVLAVGVWHFAIWPSFVGPQSPTYQTASENAAATDLNVTINETTSMGEISALLISLEGSLADGPSALGVFRLRFADQSLRDAAASAMRQRSDLFTSVLLP